MPHKFNADRRDKIPKQKQRVTNWSGTATTRLNCGRLHVEQPLVVSHITLIWQSSFA